MPSRPIRHILHAAVVLLTALIPDAAKATINSIIADPDTMRGKTLQEVTVRRTREHYSKRNNPAVEFARRIRSAGDATDPRRNKFYNYRKYDRMSFGLNDFHFPDSAAAGKQGGQFGFLREHTDTSDVTGRPILPLSVKEKVSDVLFRREPRSTRQYVSAIRAAGVDEIADMQNVQTMVEDVFREIDLYNNDINIMRNRFVSPLSRIAPDFYKFYLTDTVTIDDGTRCIVLSFAPRNPATFAFIGRLFVEEGDTAMFVRRVQMGITPTINLNFVDRMQIHQEFAKAPDGSRLKTLDDLNVELTVLPGTQPLYARRTTVYSGHSFDPSPHDEILDMMGETFTDPQAYGRDDSWWTDHRAYASTRNEARIPQLMQRLRSVPLYHYGEQVLKLLVVGYVPTGKPSKFDIGPLNTTISGNTVEGVRLRAGGMTTANLCDRFFARGYVAYGTRDRKWKYNAELEYSFKPKTYHPREFPIHSLRLSERYDIDQPGQDYAFTNPDNVFLALKRTSNRLVTYLRQTAVTYTLELPNNFSIEATAKHERQEAGPYVPFTLTNGQSIGHFDETSLTIKLRYAPGEKFYQMKTSRVPINLDAPVIILSQTFAPGGFPGNRYTINKTEVSAQKRLWFSAFGFADLMVKGGHVWSRSPYMTLFAPNANLSYTIQPESFALLNPLEFIGDSFVSWFVTYRANGALFNYIPLLKRLKLREVVAFRGWIGGITDKNNPLLEERRAMTTGIPTVPLLRFPEGAAPAWMGGRPYMEISAGIDNLLRCVRIDYVWRLTYRSTPGTPRSGIRVAFHATF